MFKFILAFIVGKAAKLALKILGKRATHFPGKIAVRICPDFLKYIGKPETVICVTGTNGKTSTCNMIEDSLRQTGVKVLDNSFGSNTLAGIAATMIDGVNAFNKPTFKVAVLEIDERSSLHIYKHITPTYFICTNLFRDSLMRNAHTEYIFSMINDYLPAGSTLILNADDIISSRLGEGKNKNRVFFGVDKLENEATEDVNIINDGRTCPNCGAKMIFDFKRYHHIGRAHCSKCPTASKTPDYRVTKADNQSMTVAFGGKEHDFPVVNSTIFNIYNEAAVIALLTEYGCKADDIASYMKNLHITDTRYNEAEAGGVKIICTMLKGFNPIACSRNCHTAKIREGNKAVFFMVDDIHYEADSSESIAWHYEADYEALNDESVKKIYVSGPRAVDIKYRLLLAGIPEDKIVTGKNEAEIIEKVTSEGIDSLLIFFDMLRYDSLIHEIKPAIVAKFSKEG